jgi:hypothetical protein
MKEYAMQICQDIIIIKNLVNAKLLVTGGVEAILIDSEATENVPIFVTWKFDSHMYRNSIFFVETLKYSTKK